MQSVLNFLVAVYFYFVLSNGSLLKSSFCLVWLGSQGSSDSIGRLVCKVKSSKFVLRGVVSLNGNNSCCVSSVKFLWLVVKWCETLSQKEWLFLIPGDIQIEKDGRYL